MKSFIKKIVSFFGLPLFRFSFGLFLMVVPPIYAASIGILDLEPGFSYGVFYGVGSYCFFDSGFDLFIIKK